jgi:hypothetical protein
MGDVICADHEQKVPFAPRRTAVTGTTTAFFSTPKVTLTLTN